MYINMPSLESFLPICPHLATGNSWRSKEPATQISVHNIKYVFNLRPSAMKKDEHGNDVDQALWYREQAIEAGVRQVFHIPMETKEDRDRTKVKDADVLRIATQVAMRVLELKKEYHAAPLMAPHGQYQKKRPCVFVHGYRGANVAMVVALVAWYLVNDDNTFDPMQSLTERYDETIAENFPEHWFHREQVTRICNQKRKSVYASMRRGGWTVTRVAKRSTPRPKKDEEKSPIKRAKN